MQQKGYTTAFEVVDANAVAYTIPAGVNVIYMFNSFGSETMQKVVPNIVAHAKKTGNNIYVVYCMPSFQFIFEALPGAEGIICF